jgi:hypothetical protein
MDIEGANVTYPHSFEAKVVCRENSFSWDMYCEDDGTWHSNYHYGNCSGMFSNK